MTYDRLTFLAEMSEEEIRNLSPWDLFTAPNAQAYLITVSRTILGYTPRYGIEALSNDEILHELFPMLYDDLRTLLQRCAGSEVKPENRDRFIFGSLRRLIQRRLLDQIFGDMPSQGHRYIDEVMSDEYDNTQYTKHNLMSPLVTAINSYLEAQPSYTPQFLSEAPLATDTRTQDLNRMIERVRPYLTSREADVLRSLLLSCEDRSILALEIGTTPKMISRYRNGIQKKLRNILKKLNWDAHEIEDLLRSASDQTFTEAC